MTPPSPAADPTAAGLEPPSARRLRRRPPGHQHRTLPGGGPGRAGQLRPPRGAPRPGADGLLAVEPPPALQPGRPRLAQPRPLRPLLRPRLGDALRPAPPRRLRPAAGRADALPPARLEDPRPPRARPDAGGGDHHRSARPGARERRWHGDRRAPARRPLQPRRLAALRPPGVGLRQRRRHDGGGGVGSLVAGRPPRPRQAQRPLRLQPHHDRRAHLAGLLGGRRAPLRGLRLARPAGRRRQRPRRPRRRHPRRPRRDRPAVDDRGHHRDRLRQPAQSGDRRRPRLAAGAGGDDPHQAGARLAGRAGVPGPRRSAGPLPRRRRAGRGPPGRVGGAARALGRGPPRAGRRPRRPPRRRRCPPAGRRRSPTSPPRTARWPPARLPARPSTPSPSGSPSWSAARPTSPPPTTPRSRARRPSRPPQPGATSTSGCASTPWARSSAAWRSPACSSPTAAPF